MESNVFLSNHYIHWWLTNSNPKCRGGEGLGLTRSENSKGTKTQITRYTHT
jgi:hypothetical protein